MLLDNKEFLLPELEEKVLSFWKKNHIFEESLAQTKNGKKFVFYEGPPGANGRPGIHHVLARIFKDIILRYRTMQGFFVPRKSGWDTHGLPVEIEAEKQLGITSKKEIETLGVAAFNTQCRNVVWQYKQEWEKLTERIGYWIDLKNPYITYDNTYIETVWWIIKEIWKKKLLYKGYKIVSWCTRCETALSSHELALGYKTVTDTSAYIKFKLIPEQKIGNFITDNHTYILSWTTTLWTLPGNVALAVGNDIDYAIVKSKENSKETLLCVHERLSSLGLEMSNSYIVRGKELVGLSYIPLFNIQKLQNTASYKIYSADFVTTTDGTGVVHTAVMYGEDDYVLGTKVGLPQIHTVDEQGRFVHEIPIVSGMYAKAKKTEEIILTYLRDNNNLFREESYVHEYPFCWRCATPLLYYARESWFIAMSTLRKQLLHENSTVNWIPQTIRDGRFGEWLRETKDWNISRERYWGTPLPVWQCEMCDEYRVVGSIKELEDTKEKSTNHYIFVRHGESENNVKNIVSSYPEQAHYPLTSHGKIQVQSCADILQKKKVDYIISSDVLRAKETAEILGRQLHVPVLYDARLREIDFGKYNNTSSETYRDSFTSFKERFSILSEERESLQNLRIRTQSFFEECEKKYTNKTIVVVGHGDPLWIASVIAKGYTNEKIIRDEEEKRMQENCMKNAEIKEVILQNISRNESGALDLHKPYIDEMTFSCAKCSGTMRRVKEVIDVWFDSGAMPFAQAHYPFATKKIDYPAEYITEAIDQTRGWFYTLLAIAVLLGKKTPFQNVICLGLLVDKEGQKMSKSKGNVVDSWTMIQKYGVDAVRWYFYTVNPPGESKKFNEIELAKTTRQFFLLIYNSFIFLNTYGAHNEKKVNITLSKHTHILDRWIYARLYETIKNATEKLDMYNVGEAAKYIEEFAGDCSRWYIRRSRRRFQKPETQEDLYNASYVLRDVLRTLVCLLAPFTPFFAEMVYLSLDQEKKSVHLEKWPKINKKHHDEKLCKSMKEVRRIASIALALRAEKGIKVRQPLQKISIKNKNIFGNDKNALYEILKDEVNVKEIIYDATQNDEIVLDTTVTHELKEEGMVREFIRMVQDLRQDAKLTPHNAIVLFIDGGKEILFVFEKYKNVLQKELRAIRIEHKRTSSFIAEIESVFEGEKIWIGIQKNKE